MSGAKLDDKEFDSDGPEEDLDEELALPSLLSDIGYHDKKELLIFKRGHNEREWELEVSRRTDLLAKKVDMERLKKMSKGFVADKPKSAAKSKKSAPAARGKRGAKIDSDEDSDEDYGESKSKRHRSTRSEEMEVDEKEEDEESEVEVPDDEEDEDDDDDDDMLFDSDEEEEITRRGAAAAASQADKSEDKKTSKVLGRKKKEKQAPRRSGRKVPSKYSDDEEEEGEVEDDDERVDTKRVSSEKMLSKSRGGLDAYDDRSDVDDDDDEEEKALQIEKEDLSPPAKLENYLRIQSRRIVLEKWLSEPFFEQAVVGTFVRLSIGEFESQQVYRMCEIIAIEYNQRPYKLDNGKMCSVRLTLSFAGTIRKGSKIVMVSNSRITQGEFEKYESEIKARNDPSVRLLTENQVNERRNKQLTASRHVYTHQEIKDMVHKKSGMNKALVTEYSTAMESLQKKLVEARAEKDLDALEAVQKTIELLEAESNRQREANERASKHHIEVNKRSRESNVQRDMAAGMRKRQEEMEAAATGKLSNAVLDPFLRRETRPKILWNTGSKLKDAQEKDSGNAAAATVTTAANGTNGAATKNGDTNNTNTTVGHETTSNSSHNPQHTIELFKVKNPDPTLDEARERIKKRFGVDPYVVAVENPRDRYLRKVCAGLPPLNSEERNKLRGASKSLDEVMEMVRNIREDEAMQQ